MEKVNTSEKFKHCSLTLLTSFSLSLIAFRIIVTHSIFYGFLIINLALAAVPYLISEFALEFPSVQKNKWKLLATSALWLLFLPNAPYILTDFLHFKRESNMPEWFDVLMLATFTCSGLAFGFSSIATMHNLWKNRFGKKISNAFLISICLLCGLGIFLGRFMRYNSWDLLHRPVEIFTDTFFLLGELKTIGFSIGYGLFLFLFYNFFRIHSKNN